MEAKEPQFVSANIVTVPNALSILRLALVPVFLVLLITDQDLWALAILVVSSATDFLDGLIARRFNQISRLGQLLDPAADRLFIFASLVGLSVRQVIPLWFVVVIIAREVLLAGIGLVLLRHRFAPLPVHSLGKLATFCLFIALPLLLLGQVVPGVGGGVTVTAWALAGWGAFLYWWVGILYLIRARVAMRSTHLGGSNRSDTLGRREVHDGQFS